MRKINLKEKKYLIIAYHLLFILTIVGLGMLIFGAENCSNIWGKIIGVLGALLGIISMIFGTILKVHLEISELLDEDNEKD